MSRAVRRSVFDGGSSTTTTGLTRVGETSLRFLPHMLVLAVIVGQLRGDADAYRWVGLFMLVAPLAEWMLGRDLVVSGDAGLARRAAPWLWVPLHIGLLGVGLMSMRRLEALSQTIGPGIATGLLCGTFGMAAAHELLHRGRWARRVARVLLALSAYAHFAVEHVHGHHARVGTHADPASARLGEGVYAFLWRSVPAAWQSARRIERVRRRHHIAGGVALSLALVTAAAALAGVNGIAFVVVQAVVAVAVLEVTNYLQHYGLARTRANEPIAAHHIWDCPFRVTNLLLFDLGRHAEHHLCTRPAGNTPCLPAGYFTMFSLAMLPPLWRVVMDPRVAWVVRCAAVAEPAEAPR